MVDIYLLPESSTAWDLLITVKDEENIFLLKPFSLFAPRTGDANRYAIGYVSDVILSQGVRIPSNQGNA